jgi:hypothetical protein
MTSTRPLASLALLAATLALAACGPPTTDARRLWLNSPRDGVLTLEDHEPPPF